MKVQILFRESCKARIFEGIVFPITVEAKPIKKGLMKGWVIVTHKAMSAAGVPIPDHIEGFEDDHDLGYTFSPAACVKV